MHHHTSSYQFNLLYLRQLSSRHDKFSTRILPRHRLKNLCVPYININIPFIFSRSFILKRRVIMNQTFFDPFYVTLVPLFPNRFISFKIRLPLYNPLLREKFLFIPKSSASCLHFTYVYIRNTELELET